MGGMGRPKWHGFGSSVDSGYFHDISWSKNLQPQRVLWFDAERHERLPPRAAQPILAAARGDGCEQPVAVSGATGTSQFGMARKGRD